MPRNPICGTARPSGASGSGCGLDARGKLLLLGLFVVISLITRGAFIGVEIINGDEAAHIVGSWELLRGNLLYTDFADNKPPLLYAYFALVQLLFGMGMLAVYLFTITVTVPLTALAVSHFFRYSRTGVVAGAVYLVYGSAFFAGDMLAVNCELLTMLPAAWAVALLRDEHDALSPPRCLSAGLLIGAASLFKQQAIFWLPGMALACIAAVLAHREWTGARKAAAAAKLGSLMAVGAAVPLLAAYAAFAARGGQGAFLYWVVEYNIEYISDHVPAAEVVRRIIVNFGPFLLATCWLWWGAARALRHAGSRYFVVLSSGLILFSFIPAAAGMRLFGHYFIQFYIPLAIASAPCLEALVRRPLGLAAKLFVAYSVLTWIVFTVINVAVYRLTDRIYEVTFPVYRHVAQKIEKDPCRREGASMFVWGYSPMFYYYAGLPVATRFVLPQSTITGFTTGYNDNLDIQASRRFIRRDHWSWMMADLKRKHATYIIDTAPAALHSWDKFPLKSFPELQEYVKKNYNPVGIVDSVHLYRLKSCARLPQGLPPAPASLPAGGSLWTAGAKILIMGGRNGEGLPGPSHLTSTGETR